MTLNRIRKLLPTKEGLYKVDPGRRTVATTYGTIMKLQKEERLAAAATSGEAASSSS